MSSNAKFLRAYRGDRTISEMVLLHYRAVESITERGEKYPSHPTIDKYVKIYGEIAGLRLRAPLPPRKKKRVKTKSQQSVTDFRKSLGLSQLKLSRRLFGDDHTVCSVENGYVKLNREKRACYVAFGWEDNQ